MPPTAVAAGARKAAILLMSLPEGDAAKVLGMLDPKSVESVTLEIARLGPVTSSEQEGVIVEFAESNPDSLGVAGGGLDIAKKLVEGALGAKANDTLENIRQSIESMPFSFLKGVDPQNLLTFVIDEHPQTIALILSYVSPSYSANVLAGLPAERQLAVIRRIANMGQTNPEVIKEVERGLESRMASVMSQSFNNAGGVPRVAEILNVTDRATERALLENLSQEDPTLVEDIRRLMFVFEDISKLADKDIQAILKNVETSQWAMALKNASEELKQKILGNMASRAAAMLKEEMQFLGKTKLSDVEGIQQQIVDVVRRLEDAGEITVGGGDDDEQYV